MNEEVLKRLLTNIPKSLIDPTNIAAGVLPVVVGFVLAAVLIELLTYLVLGKLFRSKYTIPYMLLMPAVIGLLFLVVYPMGFELYLAFTNMQLAEPFFRNPLFGPDQLVNNLIALFTRPVIREEFFFPLFFRTMLWTVLQVSIHITGGLALALLLNRDIKARGVYRTILVIPWAVPNVVAVLAWRGEFHFQYGVFNNLLRVFNLAPVQWKDDAFWNFVAMNLTNWWLGIPFMMVTLLGGLQSIPQDYYEAAEIDGANAWGRFQNVTLPMLQPVLTPSMILGIIWTFNNFNVPFFINERSLATSDILVTALYRAAFQAPNRYGFAATFAFVIFFILFILSLIQFKVTGVGEQLSSKKKKTVIKRQVAQAAEAKV
jgi:arabinogalactan oligomer/maltooligosaccharide transport system permease protein